MIDKKKFILFNRITLTILLILILLLITKVTLSRFQSDAEGAVESEIAFYLLDTETQTQTIKIADLKPDNSEHFYDVRVTNYKENKISEVDIEYELSLITTTNLPVEYALYYNGSNVNSLGTREVIQDDDGMYFFKFRTTSKQLAKNIRNYDDFRIGIKFPNTYGDALYQGIIELLSVEIKSKQIN